MKLTMSMFAKQEHYFEARVKQLEAERDKLKGYLLETKNALEDANGLYFSTYTTESQSPYDILIKKIEDIL